MNKVYLTYFVLSDNFLKLLRVKVVEKLDTLVFMTDLVVLFKFPKLIVFRHTESQGSSTSVLTIILREGAWDSIKTVNAYEDWQKLQSADCKPNLAPKLLFIMDKKKS